MDTLSTIAEPRPNVRFRPIAVIALDWQPVRMLNAIKKYAPELSVSWAIAAAYIWKVLHPWRYPDGTPTFGVFQMIARVFSYPFELISGLISLEFPFAIYLYCGFVLFWIVVFFATKALIGFCRSLEPHG